jgi:hypothetical protein
MIRGVHPGSGAFLPLDPGSRIQGSKRHRIPDPDTGIPLQRTEWKERGAAVPHVRRASPRAPHLTLRGSALTPPSPPLSSHQAIQVTVQSIQ